MFNDFSNGLSETRDAIANGYFWDSEAVETRLNQWVRLAKYNKVREWNTYGTSSSNKVIWMCQLWINDVQDYFVFVRSGNMFRYKTDDSLSYPSVTGSFPIGANYTDFVETPRGVYVFWEASGTISTANACKIYYIAKTVVSSAETLDYWLMFTNPERVTFTNNNSGWANFYWKKYATLIDNQALMWTSRSADGKTGIYLKDYEDLIPLTSSAVTPIDYLPWLCCWISAQGGFVYVYMQDKVFYYDIGSLLNGRATELIPTGVINTDFKVYSVLPGVNSDWVMTSNGVYQRSGISFTLMSGITLWLFSGYLSWSPLITAIPREIWESKKLTTYGRKNNFFKWWFVGSEYIDGDIETCYANDDIFVYYKTNTIVIAQKWTFTWSLQADQPWYYPVTENLETGYFAPSGKISSCRLYEGNMAQEKYIKELQVGFQLNWGTIAIDMRSNLNTTFTEIKSWTGGTTNDKLGGDKIYANELPWRNFNWLEYRVRLSTSDNTKSPVFYWIIPIYEERN